MKRSQSSAKLHSSLPLRGRAILGRPDGKRWSAILEPILRDTADLPPTEPLGLEEFDALVGIVIKEHDLYNFPTLMLHPGPPEFDQLDSLTFVSYLTAHRAERIIQCVDLGAAALDALENGSLQLAAVAARALFEISATSAETHKELLAEWNRIHGSAEAVRRIASDPTGRFWLALRGARVGTRSEALIEQGWPSAKNIITRLDHFGHGSVEFTGTIKSIYSLLCEATHPNIEAQATLWRRRKEPIWTAPCAV